ncbi:hypothetical protein HMPREF9946_02990 [Acetobacteraceae bacterium AT-5844]|nr:hypothetical protein HMPREF9946_02990 [Acetobacteraceae bacterium AT-5844]
MAAQSAGDAAVARIVSGFVTSGKAVRKVARSHGRAGLPAKRGALRRVWFMFLKTTF